MHITPTEIEGAFVCDLRKFEDERGFFAKAWSREVFDQHGIGVSFLETNFSLSHKRGTIRGLHHQRAPYAEAKLVRCVRGALFDVIVDLRPDSPSCHRWLGFELTAANHRAVYVPAGCAHGVQTLEDDTEMLYMVSAPYVPEAEAGIRWDDPFFGIEWPEVGERVVSDKDRAWPDYQPES